MCPFELIMNVKWRLKYLHTTILFAETYFFSASKKNSGSTFSLFGKASHSTNSKPPKKQSDVIERTKVALAALQQGDGRLGREKLEQALGV
mmetsp:Transcript_6674/g.10006  ORF Transcript_6674/g.10006 Transcript_6674/m.10006 type:complete len:91 (-) Transcript_6674:72-344(-)